MDRSTWLKWSKLNYKYRRGGGGKKEREIVTYVKKLVSMVLSIKEGIIFILVLNDRERSKWVT